MAGTPDGNTGSRVLILLSGRLRGKNMSTGAKIRAKHQEFIFC